MADPDIKALAGNPPAPNLETTARAGKVSIRLRRSARRCASCGTVPSCSSAVLEANRVTDATITIAATDLGLAWKVSKAPRDSRDNHMETEQARKDP